jgi:hypothetical protein
MSSCLFKTAWVKTRYPVIKRMLHDWVNQCSCVLGLLINRMRKGKQEVAEPSKVLRDSGSVALLVLSPHGGAL